MSPVVYSSPTVIGQPKKACEVYITGVNTRTPYDEAGEETITIYWSAQCDAGCVVDSGAHTIAGARLGDLKPTDAGTPQPSETYREHIKQLVYAVLIEDGVIPSGPIS